jgi:hypothetical protein
VIDDPTSGDCTDSRDSAAADAADAVTALLLRDTSEEPTDLRLADLSICELPEGFGVKNKQSSTHSLLHRFASAITLDLALNQLRALPAGFGTSLASLKVLHLGGPLTCTLGDQGLHLRMLRTHRPTRIIGSGTD